MNESLLTFIVGAVIGLIGGILPTILSNRRDEKCLKRDKLEQLYKSITNWYNTAFTNFIYFAPVLDGGYDWNVYLDKLNSIKSDGAHIQTAVLTDLYFPSVLNSFEKLKINVQKLVCFIDSDIKRDYLAKRPISQYKSSVGKMLDLCNENFEEVKRILEKEAKSLR